MRRWALVEQGALSAGNFGLALVMARTLDKAEWGTYSLGYALLLFAQGFQRAYISLPLVTMTPDRSALAATYRHWWRLQLRFGVAAILLLVVASISWSALGLQDWIADALMIAAILVPGLFGYEFVRRVLIQDGKIKLCAYASMFFLMLLIAGGAVLLGRNEGSAYVWTIGVSACSVLAALLAWAQWDRPAERNEEQGLPLKNVLHFGKWAALGHIAYASYNTGVQLVLSLVAGPAAMGQFAAVRNIVQPVNTIIGAIDSVDKPKATRAHATGGIHEMFKVLRGTVIALIGVGGAYLVACVLAGGWVIDALYAGRYGQPWFEVWLWCGAAMVMMLAQPAESGLYVVQRPDALFANRIASAVIGLGMAVILVPGMGIVGALLALIAGWFTSTLLAVWQLRRLALAVQPNK